MQQQQRIHFAHTSDGVSIAYSTSGDGLPLIFIPSWVSHLEFEMMNPHMVRFMEGMSAGGRRRLVRFDHRGNELSDRRVSDLSVRARATDIEAVMDHLGVSKACIFAWSMGTPSAILFAANNPDRVSHLVLYASFARAFEADSDRQDVGRAIVDLIRARWTIGAKAAIEFIYPNADKGIADMTATYFTNAASGDVAAAIMEESLFHVDVRDELPKLTMPTLVLHRREDEAIAFEMGREVAALLPHGHFTPLEGNIHPPFYGDYQRIIDAVDDFLQSSDHHQPQVAEQHLHSEAPGGLQIILFTDMEGSTSITQTLGDAKAQELVRAHNTIVRDGLQAHGGIEIKHTGDGIMATFSSASRALDSAIAIQQAFADHNRSAEDKVRVRIGVNAGEPVAEEEDLFGAAVQLAARVCTYAKPGQILASNVVRELTMGKGFLFADQGEVELRGFPQPVRVYEVPW